MEMNEDARVFKIRRNLLDAGCDDSLIAQFLELEQKRRRGTGFRCRGRGYGDQSRRFMGLCKRRYR